MSLITPESKVPVAPNREDDLITEPQKALFKRPEVLRLIVIALLAEIGYGVLNISTMQVYLRDDRNFGESVIGFVLVAFLLTEAIFKSPMGHVADKYGPRLLMICGPLISVFTSILSLVIPKTGGGTFEVLCFIVLRAGDGIGAAMLWPAAFALVGDTVRDDERQQAMSLLNLCYIMGIALALPIGGIVDDLSHTHYFALLVAAALFAAVSGAAFFFVPKKKLQILASEADGSEHAAGFSDLLKSVKQIPAYLILAVVTFAGIGFPMAIIKLFAQDQYGMSESQFGALVFPAAISMGLLSVPMSHLGEKLGRIRSVHFGMGLCSFGLILIASGAFFRFMQSPIYLALGGIPVGIGFLLAIPAWMASVSDIDKKRRGANLGAVMTAQGLGAIIGAPIGGALYEKLQPLGHRLHLGSGLAHYSPFVGCAVCVTLGWLIGLKILRPPAPTEAT